MKKIIFFLIFTLVAALSYSQNNNYHFWSQVKTTNCKSLGISPSIQVGNKKVSVGTAFTWNKTNCNEYTMKNAVKVPKLEKGYHVTPDGKHYYNDGNIVYQIIGKSCGSQTWTPNDFWFMMQNK